MYYFYSKKQEPKDMDDLIPCDTHEQLVSAVCADNPNIKEDHVSLLIAALEYESDRIGNNYLVVTADQAAAHCRCLYGEPK